MGADPTAIFVGLGLPGDVTTGWLDGLTDGLRDECALVGASVSGGDVARSDLVVLGVTALGDLGGRAPVTRSGARPGQIVAVAGRLGYAAAGLALLESGRSDTGELVDAHRRPQPAYSAGPEAARLGATAMVDVSDGLLQDLGHIAAASGVGIRLDPSAFTIPEHLAQVAADLGIDPLEWILTGGDDHPLAAIFPDSVRLPPHWQIVGHVTQEEGVQVRGRSQTKGGWDHFG